MQDFIERLHRATPQIWVTWSIIAINAFVFGIMVILGVNPLAPTSGDLLDLGGNYLPATLAEPWRLFSATFLHAGIIHIGFNMWALRDMGGIAERFYGNAQFLAIYLVAGLFGSLASLFYSASQAVSVGASGAIFGVAGAIMAALFTKPGKLPSALVSHMRTSMVIFVGYSLFMGFTVSFIDNSAHIGGLVSGFLMAWIMAERFDWEQFRRQGAIRAALAIALALTVAFVIWSLVPTPVH